MQAIEYADPGELVESAEINESNLPANCLYYSSPRDYIWSFLGVLVIILLFVIQEPEKLTHWMLLPLSLCGTLIGADALRWFKGTYTLFDPKGVIGIYGINFFLTAPLLIVFYDVEGIETYIVSNWQPLLGIMAIFNFLGIILYKLCEKIAFKRPSKAEYTYWALNPTKATFFVPLFVIIAFASFCIFVVRGGGFGGIILQERREAVEGLVGAGIFMVLRDALPLTVLIGLTIHRMTKATGEKSPWWFFLGIVMLCLFFFTSGLRGSRAATGYGLICAGAMIHYFWRRLTVKIVLISMIPLMIFFYFYSFYKSAGIEAIGDLVQGRATIADLQEQTTRTFSGMLIGDMSRAPIQAAEIDVLVHKPWDYRYRYGTTYPLALGYLIPRQIWRTKPIDMGRIIAGTEMLYGPESYGAFVKYGGSGSRSTQLYGLAGEAILNFGIYGILPVFAIWGYIVGRIRKRIYSFRAGDMRLMMSGFWLLVGFIILASDADQFVWFFTSLYVIPAFLIYLISDKLQNNTSYE